MTAGTGSATVTRAGGPSGPSAARSVKPMPGPPRRQSSSANPDHGQLEEDSFAAGTAELLNRQVLEGTISGLIIIAAPKTLGELRKHYHKKFVGCARGGNS